MEVTWQVVHTCVTVGTTLLLWQRTRSLDQSERVTKLELEHAKLAERVTHMPSSDEVNELSGAMRELAAEMRAVKGQLEAVSRRLDQHDEWLQDAAAQAVAG